MQTLRLVLVLALLSLASGLPSRAIDQCHAPCLTALGQCIKSCGGLQAPAGSPCIQRCDAIYSACLANTVCPPTGQR